jgi:hypothetical protein
MYHDKRKCPDLKKTGRDWVLLQRMSMLGNRQDAGQGREVGIFMKLLAVRYSMILIAADDLHKHVRAKLTFRCGSRAIL